MARQHSLNACKLLIGSILISEYGESDAIGHSPNSDLAEAKVNADGTITMDRTNDSLMIATLTLKQTGYAYRHLATLAQAQDTSVRNSGIVPPTPYSYVNLATGDTITCPEPQILNLPDIMANKASGEVTVRIALPGAAVVFGGGITPTLGA